MDDAPIENGTNGRDSSGRFTHGNPGGPGNPQARRSAELRRALLEAMTPEDLLAVVRTLVERAKAGEPWAVKEFLDRLVGRPVTLIEMSNAEREQNSVTLNGRAVLPSLDPKKQAELDEFRRRIAEDVKAMEDADKERAIARQSPRPAHLP